MTQTKVKAIDPVSGKEVGTDSPYHSFYNNGYYYFVNAANKEEFDKQPEKYAKEETPTGGCD